MANEEQFHSTSGFSTRAWGPAGWFFLFSCILGAYPVRITKSKNHIMIRKHFKALIQSLQYTMPCVFCRNSFKKFYKQIPISPYLIGRIELAYWLYKIRDLVNKKLQHQELECYNTEKQELKKKYNSKKISKKEYYRLLQSKKKEIFITQPSPLFIDVLYDYEQFRAVCSPLAQTCA